MHLLFRGPKHDITRRVTYLGFISLTLYWSCSILTRSEFSNMSSLPTHLPQPLTVPQSPMEYCFARLAAGSLIIILLWLAVKFCNIFRLKRSSWGRSSEIVLGQELLKSREICINADTFRSAQPSVNKTQRKSPIISLNPRLLVMRLSMAISLLLLWRHLSFAFSFQGDLQSLVRSSSETPKSTTGLQDVFQVYQPVPFDSSGNNNCDVEILLMEHVFGASYGAPFVGNYNPPSCDFDTVRINLTVTSRGRQYDRLAIMYLGDNEVFRTSTAEPTSSGIVWTYVKEMSQYISLWKSPQKLIFDLGNIINDVYTGSFNATLTAHFSSEQNVETADMILPISAKRSASNSSSAFRLPTDNTTVMYKIPTAASRAVVSISACGQSEEEFWWSNVFSGDTQDFESTVGGLYGYTPFREIQLYIDGILAGVVWPFPIIFTGGVAPGFWRPVVGTDAFDLRQPEIDISPFLPMVQDGKPHSFEIRVTGLNVSADGSVKFANTVGSYWVVTGNIFLYINDDRSPSEVIGTRDNKAPKVDAPSPVLATTRNLIHNETGGIDSLSYSVVAKRTFSASSSLYLWSQTLSFFNRGLLNQHGYSQVNRQFTTGNNTITKLGDRPKSNSTAFQYPLVVNATYCITSDGLTIDSWMKRGLTFEATGGLGISTYTLASGPSYLQTSQSGTAQYKPVTGGRSSSWGDTIDEFESQMNGRSYRRSVQAVNGTVLYDTDPKGAISAPSSKVYDDSGRDSVRAILGKGPGAPSP